MRETVISCDICKKPAREFVFRGIRCCAEDDGDKSIDLCDAHAVDFLQCAMKHMSRSEFETILDSFQKIIQIYMEQDIIKLRAMCGHPGVYERDKG